MNLEKGSTYYFITYADAAFTMPGVRPVIYVGKEENFQFQDTVSFKRFGFVTDMEPENRKEARVTLIPENEIGTTIVCLSGAIEVLLESRRKAEEAGNPPLSVSKGRGE